jgi:hypothetical protein
MRTISENCTIIEEYIELLKKENEALKFKNAMLGIDVESLKSRIQELEKANEWVSVSERLPTSESLSHSNTEYLVMNSNGTIRMCRFINHIFLTANANPMHDATHWKSITPPKQPKAAGE